MVVGSREEVGREMGSRGEVGWEMGSRDVGREVVKEVGREVVKEVGREVVKEVGRDMPRDMPVLEDTLFAKMVRAKHLRDKLQVAWKVGGQTVKLHYFK